MPLRAFSILQIVSFLSLMIVCRVFSIPVYVECAFLLAIHRLPVGSRQPPGRAEDHCSGFCPPCTGGWFCQCAAAYFPAGTDAPHHLRVPVLSGTASGHHFCHLSCSDLELRGRDCGDLSGEEEF